MIRFKVKTRNKRRLKSLNGKVKSKLLKLIYDSLSDYTFLFLVMTL